MSAENSLSKVTLQRCEPQAIVTITLQQKLNQTIAKSTDTIVEDDQLVHLYSSFNID